MVITLFKYRSFLPLFDIFVQVELIDLFHSLHVKLKDSCHIPHIDMCWSTHYYVIAKSWESPYLSRMQVFTQLTVIR